MTQWKPDYQFLDFLLEEWQKEGGFVVGFPGEEDYSSYSSETMIQEMRKGSDLGQEVYATAYDYYKTAFETYKAKVK